MINIKNLHLNKKKIDEKSYNNILIYHMGYVLVKDLSYLKTNFVNLLYLIAHKVNGYIGESNLNKYLTLFPTDESKDTLKKYKAQWDKIRYLIRSITNNWDNYDENQIQFRRWFAFKELKLCNMIIAVRSIFHEDRKYNPQVFLDKYLYRL